MRTPKEWRRDRRRWKALRDLPLIVGVTAISHFDGEIIGPTFHPREGSVTTGFIFDGTNMPDDFFLFDGRPR